MLPRKALKTTPSSSHPAILALFDLETHCSQSLLPAAHGFVPSFSLLIRTASLEDRPTMSQYDLQTLHLQVKSRLQVPETRDENKEWSLSGCSGNPKQRCWNCTLGRPEKKKSLLAASLLSLTAAWKLHVRTCIEVRGGTWTPCGCAGCTDWFISCSARVHVHTHTQHNSSPQFLL